MKEGEKPNAVILAGGKGTRLMNHMSLGERQAIDKKKALFPVAGKPLITHALQTLEKIGIDHTLVLANNGFSEKLMRAVHSHDGSMMVSSFYDRSRHSVDEGPGVHMLNAEHFSDRKPVLLYLADNIYIDIPRLPKTTVDPRVVYAWVSRISPNHDDISKYAQVEIGDDGVIISINRTQERKSGIIQTGAWIMPADVFATIRALRKECAPGEEVRITDIVQHYVQQERACALFINDDGFVDCGTPQGVQRAEKLLQDN